MQKTILFIFGSLFLLLAIIGCTGTQDEVNSDESTGTAVEPSIASTPEFPELASVNGDTINIHGKYLLFYGPDSTTEAGFADEGSQVQLFIEISSRIIESFNQKGEISASYTTAGNIRIYNNTTGKPMVVSRRVFSEVTGFLMTDGSQPPKLHNGLMTEEQYYELIRSYFFLPS